MKIYAHTCPCAPITFCAVCYPATRTLDDPPLFICRRCGVRVESDTQPALATARCPRSLGKPELGACGGELKPLAGLFVRPALWGKTGAPLLVRGIPIGGYQLFRPLSGGGERLDVASACDCGAPLYRGFPHTEGCPHGAWALEEERETLRARVWAGDVDFAFEVRAGDVPVAVGRDTTEETARDAAAAEILALWSEAPHHRLEAYIGHGAGAEEDALRLYRKLTTTAPRQRYVRLDGGGLYPWMVSAYSWLAPELVSLMVIRAPPPRAETRLADRTPIT